MKSCNQAIVAKPMNLSHIQTQNATHMQEAACMLCHAQHLTLCFQLLEEQLPQKGVLY